MEKKLTACDIKVLQALCEFGPRNLSKVAKHAGIPSRTLGSLIERMKWILAFF